MAVTPVGQNRPQAPAPAQLEATPLAAEKSGAGGAVAVARASAGPDQAVQAQYARDAFDPGTADQAQALGGPDQAQDSDPFSQALNSLVQALNSVVELVKNLLPPEATGGADPTQNGGVGQNGEQATTQDPNAPITRDLLDNRGGGPGTTPGAPGDPTAPIRTQMGLGPQGPGIQGTQPGAYGVAGLNQNDPNQDGKTGDYKFGQTNCAPTSMAEIARGKALADPNYSLTWKDAAGTEQTKKVADMTNDELVSALGKVGDTNDKGTSPNGVIDMANSMGEPVTDEEVKYDKNFEAGKPSNSFDQAWLDDKLNNGEKVVVNGAYEATDDKGQTGLVGHFMTIAGKNQDGTYAVMDPWDGKQKNLTGDEVRRFMQANPTNGGVMLAIGKTPTEQAAAAKTDPAPAPNPAQQVN
jgi:hypothetical protein